MSVYRAGRPLELAPGKAAVALANVRELNELLDNLISAVRAGELDEHLARTLGGSRSGMSAYSRHLCEVHERGIAG
jgi:hypothetical protein